MTNNVEYYLKAKQSVEQLFLFYETQELVEKDYIVKLEILSALDELCKEISISEQGDV